MKTYQYQAVVAPDEGRWIAYCPVLEAKGAATWGSTREEAIQNIREVLKITLDSMARQGEGWFGVPRRRALGHRPFFCNRWAVKPAGYGAPGPVSLRQVSSGDAGAQCPKLLKYLGQGEEKAGEQFLVGNHVAAAVGRGSAVCTVHCDAAA